MTAYPVYLERSEGGWWMAHVLALPGCFARATSRAEVLGGIRQAIADYHDWLLRHGETELEKVPGAEIEVAGEFVGTGPFDPGDAAALFPPEREPVSREEMALVFRLMEHARRDLKALAGNLPEQLLDWRPFPGSYTLRRVLRHIGNADEWYVSRIVSPETLPPEWADDEQMPLLEFLEMSRRTAVERLKRLTEEQRSKVVFPDHHTSHPEEAWSARKVLRRFLEHELEHTAQVRENLSARKQWLLAKLAEERANLLGQLLGLHQTALTDVPVLGAWTAKDILVHIAGWDRWEAGAMQAMAAGEEPDWEAVRDIDKANRRFVAAWHGRTFDEVLAELLAARQAWIGWLRSLPEEEFYRARSFHGYDWTFSEVPLVVQWKHDAEHAQQLAAWRMAEGHERAGGPKAVLVAALDCAREELKAAAALVPDRFCDTEPVCGEWTLKDLLGHLADWERFGVDGVRLIAGGQAPEVEEVTDIDGWNAQHVEARREQPCSHVRVDVDATRETLLMELDGLGEREMTRVYPFPWGVRGTAYDWLCVFLEHDRGHAEDLRRVVPES